MKHYIQLVLKGLPWALTTFAGTFIIMYLPKEGINAFTIIVGLLVFSLFAGPLFVLAKDKEGKE